MEGLIPLLFSAIKNQSHHHHNHGMKRCLSDGSRHGVRHHLLSPRGDSRDGSSHRRTLSEMYQPPSAASVGLFQQHYESRKRLNGGYHHEHGQVSKEGGN